MDFSENLACTGIYHIHSNYSYDGSNRLEEIAVWARTRGIRFVLLTEHDLGFDREKYEKYRSECEKYSGDVLLVPGMEYEVIRQGAIIHIGAIGAASLVDDSTVRKGILPLIDAIHQEGGLAVLHHPNNIKHVLTKEHLAAFDFIELWNTKFDCDFGPNTQFVRWLEKMGSQGPYLISADIHQVENFGRKRIAHIDVEKGSPDIELNMIVDCLKKKRYRCRKADWTMLPAGHFNVPHFLYNLLPWVCLAKKKIFRLAKHFVPERYQKAVYKFVNKSLIR